MKWYLKAGWSIPLILRVIYSLHVCAQTTYGGTESMNIQAVVRFAEAINAHDVDALFALMTEDHRFIDSQGNAMAGREKMRNAWIGYFQLFPDYYIELTDTYTHGDTVAAFGFAGGTYRGRTDWKENSWRLPAAWRAVVKEGKIQLWQVYADSKIPYDIISKQLNAHE